MNLSCQSVAVAVLGEPLRYSGAERFFRCPNHEDKHPSLQINEAKNVFICGPCSKSGNAWRLAAFLSHNDPQDKRAVAGWLRDHGLLDDGKKNGNGNGNPHIMNQSSEPKQDWVRVAEFSYGHDLRKIRLERPASNGSKPEKTFRWEHRDGDTWRAGAGSLEKPLYANTLFGESDQIGLVLAVEGESKVDLAQELGFAAFSFKNLMSAHCDALAGLEVVVWPDADAPGFKQANEAAKIMHESKQPQSIRKIIPPPDFAIAADIVDAVRSLGWDRARIEKLIAESKPYPAEALPVGTLLASVVEQKVDWLWPGLIPMGAPTILDGDPGVGKSLLTDEISSRVSRGNPLPGDTSRQAPAGVVILSAEDSISHVIVPRLRTAGADLSRILAVPYSPSTPGEQTFSKLPADLPVLERAIQRVGAKLVIFDVLACYIPITLSMQKDQDVRLALAPLAEMADRLQVACLLLRHLNKDTSKSTIFRGGGSIGILGAARSGLLLANNPDDPQTRVLALIKSNFGAPRDSLTFKIQASEGIPYIEWLGTTKQTAEELLAPQTSEEQGAVRDAAEFLRAELADGPVESKQLEKAVKGQGLSWASVRRAKSIVANSHKVGSSGTWFWELKR